MSSRLMSFMARMRSDTGSLEHFHRLDNGGGMSILCWEKYWQRSAKRVLSFANSFCSAGNEFSRCSYSFRSSIGPDSPPGSNLSRARTLASTGSLFVFRHLFANSFFIPVCELRPFETAVLLLLLLEPPADSFN